MIAIYVLTLNGNNAGIAKKKKEEEDICGLFHNLCFSLHSLARFTNALPQHKLGFGIKKVFSIYRVQ